MAEKHNLFIIYFKVAHFNKPHIIIIIIIIIYLLQLGLHPVAVVLP
jgi:hypothetical protein